MFEELEAENPEHFAVRQYRKYKLAAGKTAKSILISCGARLAPFDIQELRDLMEYDEMELDMLGDQRTAMFVIISDTDDTFFRKPDHVDEDAYGVWQESRQVYYRFPEAGHYMLLVPSLSDWKPILKKESSM